MPITPLHYGVLAPLNHFFPGKVSLISFTLINLWMDGSAIGYYAFGLEGPEPLHSPFTHSLLAAVVVASILALFGFRSLKWVVGAYVGGISHVLLDTLVHSDMQPLYPIHWNPFYVGIMETLSLALLPLMIWFIVQLVCDGLAWVKQKQSFKPSPE